MRITGDIIVSVVVSSSLLSSTVAFLLPQHHDIQSVPTTTFSSGLHRCRGDHGHGATTIDVTEDPSIAMTEESIDSNSSTRPSPGFDENILFTCDPSVDFWREFQRNGLESAEKNVQSIAEISTSFAQKGPTALWYWIRHAGRSGYFLSNALLANLGFTLHERVIQGETADGISVLNLDTSSASRIILEAFLSYQQDYATIEAGITREPWDMKVGHRQSNPINFLTQTSRFVDEAIGTLSRKRRARKEDKEIWISNDSTPGLYPDYYRNAFHYQSDGWMSQKSANVYETSTETLFFGRQDAMQRTSLKPLVELSKKIQAEGRTMKVLEVACGTGRFMTFVRDNLPLDSEYTAIDLSPYYLDAARDNDKYWRRTRMATEKGTSSSSSSSTTPTTTMVDILPAKIIQAQAENLPFPSESFDAVICVYLFHEIPRTIREQVVGEMARVLKPGGTVVLTDSVQLGDRPILDHRLALFEDFNEPFYMDYIQDFLPTHFENAGLVPMTKIVRSTTKSLSFSKPS